MMVSDSIESKLDTLLTITLHTFFIPIPFFLFSLLSGVPFLPSRIFLIVFRVGHANHNFRCLNPIQAISVAPIIPFFCYTTIENLESYVHTIRLDFRCRPAPRSIS